MGNRDYYEEKVDQFKMAGGYKAYLTIAETRQFDEYMQGNESFKSYIKLQRLLDMKTLVLQSEIDFSRREKLEAEILSIAYQVDDAYYQLYNVSKEWYENLLAKEISDGEGD